MRKHRYSAIRDAAHTILLKNTRMKDGFVYTVPSPETYPYQWLWDSCFHALVFSHFDPERAKNELRSLVSKQFENGLIPHIIYWQRGEVVNFKWGKEGTSSLTQPPLLSYVVNEIYEKDGDKKFLEEMYPHLYHYYTYLITERDPRHNHLAGIINPDESGEDNSPRFDIPLGLPFKQSQEESLKKRLELIEQNRTCDFDAPFCMKNFFWVKDVPFNVIFIESLRKLAVMSEKLERNDDALYFKKHAEYVRAAMREKMNEDGIFYSTHGSDYRKIKVRTWAIFAPLFAGLATKEEAEFLVSQYLLNHHEFNAHFLLPTVSLSEPSYDPRGFWRGPVWMASNWIVYKGLLKYGMHDLADLILDSSMSLLEQSGFREQFHPETGEGQGASDFTWGSLVIDMVESGGVKWEVIEKDIPSSKEAIPRTMEEGEEGIRIE